MTESKLERRIRLASGVAISLIVGGLILWVNNVISPLVQATGSPTTANSMRANLIAAGIASCFLLMVTNYVCVRIAIARATRR
jgi:hypothetical protein